MFSGSKRSSNIFTPLKRSSFVDDRSYPASILETPQYVIENVGRSLPVLITEAMIMTDVTTQLSVRIYGNGWALLVGGRKLIVWNYKHSLRHHYCHELLLPPSDLAHNANRVCILCDDQTNVVSCLAVSPEGVFRYWPNVTHESSSVEISAQLSGEECDVLLDFEPFGCLLGTTTSSFLLISPSSQQGSISCRALKAGQGMLSGIGRRMSSFFFGSSHLQIADAHLQRLLVNDKATNDEERVFYMLCGGFIQKWTVSTLTDRIDCHADAKKLFADSIAKKVWDHDSCNLPQLKVWIMDIALCRFGLLIAGSAVNLDSSTQIYYGLGCISMDQDLTSMKIFNFGLLDFSEEYSVHNEAFYVSHRLLVPEQNVDLYFLYSNNQVLIISGDLGTDSLSVSKAEFKSNGEGILGTGVYKGNALFFSNYYGLISIISSAHGNRNNNSVMDQSLHDVSLMDSFGINASLKHASKLSNSGDKFERFKGAFLFLLSGEMTNVDKLIEDLFPGLESSTGYVPELDQLVLKLCLDVIDDYPTADPRWAQSLGSMSDATGSTNSLIVLKQLRDKQKAYYHVMNFLKKISVYDKLTYVSVPEGIMSTKRLLFEQSEKLAAACTLREHHAEHSSIVDRAITCVLERRYVSLASYPNLTKSDIFYRPVSQLHEIWEILVEQLDDTLCQQIDTSDVVSHIKSVNTLLQSIFQAIYEHRKNNVNIDSSESPSNVGTYRDFVPWAESTLSAGGRAVLRKQFSLTLEHGVKKAESLESQSELLQQLFSLADVILCGFVDQINQLLRDGHTERSKELSAQFESERTRLISPFSKYQDYEKAISLAEKYYDFQTLIQICDFTGNEEWLRSYQEQFSSENFSQQLFDWYLREGKEYKIYYYPGDELEKFLQNDSNKLFRWLYDIQTNNFTSAHENLLGLASEEQESLFKRKTMFSISKLAALASNDKVELQRNLAQINDQLLLIKYQEDLPKDLIESYGMSVDTMRVLSPEEIIELLISKKNEAATEYDFKKALDILHFIDDFSKQDYLKQRIWCKAITHNNWNVVPSGDPQDVYKDMIFFKIIDLAFKEGTNIKEFFPDIEAILKSDILGDLRDNRNFEFLLKAGIEEIHEIIC